MCCGKFVTCRLCHDETESHQIDRHATKEMLCMHCGVVQPCGQKCGNAECGKILARCDPAVSISLSLSVSLFRCNSILIGGLSGTIAPCASFGRTSPARTSITAHTAASVVSVRHLRRLLSRALSLYTFLLPLLAVQHNSDCLIALRQGT